MQNREQLRKDRTNYVICCCIIYACCSAGHSPKVSELALFLPYLPAGEVRCEPPNNKLDKFSGILNYLGYSYYLDHDRLLLRGCIIRNTDWCCGLVIYTGRFPYTGHSQTQAVGACSPPSYRYLVLRIQALIFKHISEQ